MSKLRSLVLTTVLLLTLGVHASHAKSDEATMLEQGMKQYQTGNYYFASTWFERILKQYPASAKRQELLTLLATSFAATGREEKAVQTLSTLLKAYPKAAETLDPKLLQLAGSSQAVSPVAVSPAPVLTAKPAALPPAAVSAPVPAAGGAAAVPGAEVGAAPKAPAPSSVSLPAVAAPKLADEAQPAVAKAPVAKPAVAKAAPPAPLPAPGIAPAAPAAAPAPQVKPAGSATAPVAAARPLQQASVPVQQIKPAKVAKQAKPAKQQAKQAAQSAPAEGTAVFTLQVGEFVAKSALAEAVRKVESVGLKPMVGQGPKKKEQRIRLYHGEYATKELAKQEIVRLSNAKADGFFLKERDGKYRVYAGSYASEKSAEQERQRVAPLGIKLTLKPVMVAVPSFLVLTGSFSTRAAAQARAQELEKQGLKAEVIELGAQEAP